METKTSNAINVQRSKSGLPVLWMAGGATRNAGYACIVANSDGNPKKPIYERMNGERANSIHALVVVEPGDFVLYHEYGNGDVSWKIEKIENINGDSDIAETFVLGEFKNGDSWGEYPDFLKPALSTLYEYAHTYHARNCPFIER